MSGTALVFCGGGPVRRPLPDGLEGARVIAADGGLTEAVRLGRRVDVLVGDLDSASPSEVARVRDAGGAVERHDPMKDATDLELALDRAVRDGADRLVVAGGDGGRLDHLLGNLALIAAPRWASIEIDAVFGAALVHVIRGEREMFGTPEELVSLVAMGGPARGVSTDGLRWRLHDAELAPGTSRGISNLFDTSLAIVRVRDGVVLAIRPGGAA
jgi:thiamine pyrophosphokinase